jgi:hypothetical protein
MPPPAACSDDRTPPILHKLKRRISFEVSTRRGYTFANAPRSDDEAGFSDYGHRLRANGLAGLTRPSG